MPEQTPFKRVVSFTKELFANYGDDDAFTLGAALAYYTVFSFAPLLVVAIAIASYFMGEDAVTGRLYGELDGLLGPDAAKTLPLDDAARDMLIGLADGDGRSLLTLAEEAVRAARPGEVFDEAGLMAAVQRRAPV